MESWPDRAIIHRNFRDRAVKLGMETTPEHPSQWAAIETIARQLGVSGETLHKWVRRAEIDRPAGGDDDRTPGGDQATAPGERPAAPVE
jgi:transposase-like protein